MKTWRERGERHGCASANWFRVEGAVLPLTSTDVASEVVMSPMSCALLFCGSLSASRSPRLSLLISAYVQTRCPLPHLSFARLLFHSFPSVGRTTFRAWMGIESASEVQPRSVHEVAFYTRSRRSSSNVRMHRRVRRTNNASASRLLGLRVRKSAFLILAYRKSHPGAWDVLKQDRVDLTSSSCKLKNADASKLMLT